MAATRPLTPGVYVTLPELVALEYAASGYSFLPRQPVHSLLAGRHASRVRGRGLDFEEIRGYLPGDDVRTIDWRVTARTGSPHVRVFNEERDRPVLFVVDQRLNMFFGTRRSMKSVVAAELAALGAWRVLSVGDRPGAVVFGDDQIVEVRPHRSRRRVIEMLAAVAEANQRLEVGGDVAPAPEMLEAALGRAERLVGHDALVVVVSDFDGWSEAARRSMLQIARHNDVIATMVFDPSRAEIPAGRLVVSDGLLQVELAGGERTRRDLASTFDETSKAREAELRALGVPVLVLSTAEPTADQLRRQFGFRPTGRP